MTKVINVIIFFLRGDFGVRRKLFGGFVLLSILVYSFLEIVNLSLLVPFFRFILEPESIGADKYSAFCLREFEIMSRKGFLMVFSFFLVFFFLIKNVIGILVNYMAGRFSFNIFQFLSDIMYRWYLFKETDVESLKASEVANQVSIVNTFSHNVLLPSIHLINEGVVVLTICISLLFLSTQGFWIALALFSFAFGLCYRMVKGKLSNTQKLLNDTYPEIVDSINMGVYGNTDIRATHSQGYFLNKFGEIILKFSRLQVRNYLFVQTPQKLLEVFVMSGVIGIGVYMAFGNNPKDIVPIMSAMGIAAYRILPSINRIMVATLSISGGYYTLEFAESLLEKEKGLFSQNKEEGKEIGNELTFQKEIRLDSLHFSYSSQTQVLKEFSLTIKKGESIGLIGKTGSGKTTLLKILLGLKKPDSGYIWIDEQRIESDTLTELWLRKIGYVQQNVYLLPTTILENIAFGQPRDLIDSVKLEKAIQDAKLDSLIQSLPQGLETKVGEFGSMLSGGQKQRIGIARALYRECEVLILDEATSALDNQTEKEIIESIKKLKEANKTLIIVAHRYSTLEHCNKIVEMKDGAISKEYSYAELINIKPIISHEN